MCDHGVGAVVSALIRFIHPSEHIRQMFPNPVAGQWLSDLPKRPARDEKSVTKGPTHHCGSSRGLQDGRRQFHRSLRHEMLLEGPPG